MPKEAVKLTNHGGQEHRTKKDAGNMHFLMMGMVIFLVMGFLMMFSNVKFLHARRDYFVNYECSPGRKLPRYLPV